LRRTYQPSCPHVLYGDQCRANKAAATSDFTVQGTATRFINLGAGWNGSDPFRNWLNGLVSWSTDLGTETRMILNAGTNGLTVGSPLRDLEVGDTVSVSLGCARNMLDCKNLHNNLVNYGGFPWLPLENPINKTQN